MDFKDFEGKYDELLGKSVVLHSSTSRQITTIERVTKTGFRVKGSSNLYSLTTGFKKGSSLWETSYCELITEEQKEALQKEFALINKKRALCKEIAEKLEHGKLKDYPLAVLEQINTLLEVKS